jgi:predicted phage tail component-like protein
MLSFIFGGKNSYTDFGIVITKRPSIPSPKRRVTNITIPGRNSSLKYDENTYEDITVTVECALRKDNLADNIDIIKGWLICSGEEDLIFDFQADKKYIAQVVNAIDFAQAYKYFSKFVIVFSCQPFKYAVDNSIINIINTGTSINNLGTIESEPVISLYGSGDIVIKINGGQINLKGITGKITINSVIQDCYDDAGNNLNGQMSGEFLKLKPGENIIEWSGNVTKIELLPNWRWL